MRMRMRIRNMRRWRERWDCQLVFLSDPGGWIWAVRTRKRKKKKRVTMSEKTYNIKKQRNSLVLLPVFSLPTARRAKAKIYLTNPTMMIKTMSSQ